MQFGRHNGRFAAVFNFYLFWPFFCFQHLRLCGMSRTKAPGNAGTRWDDTGRGERRCFPAPSFILESTHSPARLLKPGFLAAARPVPV